MIDLQTKELDEIALSNFLTYLKFPTVHPNPNYGPAVDWLLSVGRELNLDCDVVEIFPDNPILIMCWKGRNPNLPAILLNSHMDVVPVVADKWDHPPFGGVLSEDGKIFGRGTQDMKCVGIQQLEAIRRLQKQGFSHPQRTIYITFVPDEELGGKLGMKPFVAGDGGPHKINFADLNIGFCLDEGIPSSTEDYLAFYDERFPCWVKVTFRGNAGHGLALISNTAAEKFRVFLNLAMSFRESEQFRLEKSDGQLTLGDITTINMTMLHGGVQCNVVPDQLSATFDVRLTPSVPFENFKEMLNKWAEEAGGQIEFEFLNTGVNLHQSVKFPTEENSRWWSTLVDVCKSVGINVQKRIFPGATDARFLRQYHLLPQSNTSTPIEAIGFTPIRHTPVLLHDHNEYVTKEEFLHGCQLYAKLVHALAELC